MAKSRRKLLWQLYPSYLLILLLALVAIALYASRETRASYLRETADDLKARAQLMAARLVPADTLGPPAAVQQHCRRLGRLTHTRFTVILPHGKVVGDSEHDPTTMENHGDRPEIREALGGTSGRSTRFSTTLQQEMMYVAVAVRRQGREVAVIRASRPIKTISETMNRLYLRLVLAGLLVALVAGALALWVAHRINRPLAEMQAGAARFAQGDLRFRLDVPRTEEPAALAEAMNEMAEQLDGRIRTITTQRNELEAMLSSMTEAVLVVDGEGRLVRTNHAARELLDLDVEAAEGRPMQEVIRNAELHRLLARILSSREPQEAEIRLHRDADRVLSAAGAALQGGDAERIGALVVLHDLTKLKRLEAVRRDFVANVSHELKTPITAIQGFVETLRDGAVEDPAQAERFLDIVARQADRLNAIIEDLLSLSRLEGGARDALDRGETRLGDVLTAACQLCERAATERDVTVEISGDTDLVLPINAHLLEQAVVNLCDNATKYSDAGSTVRVIVEQTPAETIIAVQDEGCGIPEADRSRVFERFYRVDKARSRVQGGTGLGLAIVKHIANVHQGRVSLESALGKGSTFRIHLPRSEGGGSAS